MAQNDESSRDGELADQFGVIKEDMTKLAALLRDAATEKARAARDAASDAAARLAEDAREQTAHFRESADKAYDAGRESVRRNPALAVAVAAGVGFAIARRVMRRRA